MKSNQIYLKFLLIIMVSLALTINQAQARRSSRRISITDANATAPAAASNATTNATANASAASNASNGSQAPANAQSGSQDNLDNSHPANQIFADSPKGRHTYDDVQEDDVYIEDIHIIPNSDIKNDPVFNKFHLRLNNHALFYSKDDDSYRGVLGSIKLSSLAKQTDKLLEGDCCGSLSKIVRRKITQNVTERTFTCFDITSKYNIWKLCFKRFSQANTWKKNIKIAIIKSELARIGMTDVQFITDLDDTSSKKRFSWSTQDQWEGLCKTGTQQSPVLIDRQSAQNIRAARLQLKLTQHQYNRQSTTQSTTAKFTKKNIHEHQFPNPHARWDGKEMSIRGNYGKVTHQLGSKIKSYDIYKIQFKFPAEHTVDGLEFDSEILLHATTESGSKSITSILVQKDTDYEVQENQFLNDINSEQWNRKRSGDFYEIKKNPDLALISDDFTIADFVQKFTWYQGSESKPPCTEGVMRFVINTPIKIPSEQLESLQKQVYSTNDEPNGNFRIPIKMDEGREIFYHQERTCGSPKSKKDPILDMAYAMENKTDTTEIKEENCQKTKGLPKKYYRATTSATTYGYAEALTTQGVLGNGISINYVDESKVPKENMQKLKKTAQMKAILKCKDKEKLQQQYQEKLKQQVQALKDQVEQRNKDLENNDTIKSDDDEVLN